MIALFVIWLIVAYNSLVRSRMHTKESWSQIDVQLKRRNDLIPNLIETVKGYAAYEGKTLEKIAELRAQVAKANTPAEAMTASNELTRQLSSILAVAENYPDLKANNSFVKLQEELTNTE
ncbi:LemA family protein, partial [Streptococcus agalactiae]|nr:LemA family protein [Streptococcus agalactiae]